MICLSSILNSVLPFSFSLDTSDWPYKLSYGEGNTIPVTKLFKDPDFGGGAGSGGGADDTKYTESGQCYFTSLVFNVIKKELKQRVHVLKICKRRLSM